MNTIGKILVWMLLVLSLILGGCQSPTKVLIRDSGNRLYNDPADEASQIALEHWEYGVLSRNVYLSDWEEHSDPTTDQQVSLMNASQDAYGSCPLPKDILYPLEKGWSRWTNFPDKEDCNEKKKPVCLLEKAEGLDLHIEVWEKQESSSLEIAVVFRGTDSWLDWLSNLNWIGRYLPFWRDQYSLVAEEFGNEFVEHLAKKMQKDDKNIRIIATGHSLGGGLAQYFAYSLPEHPKVPRVRYVYAFDPSPVTGWFAVDDKEQRDINASKLKIDRIFEHGEALAYVRLLLSYVYRSSSNKEPSKGDPAIREIRYNFDPSANPFKSHSMGLLACNLYQYHCASNPDSSECQKISRQ